MRIKISILGLLIFLSGCLGEVTKINEDDWEPPKQLRDVELMAKMKEKTYQVTQEKIPEEPLIGTYVKFNEVGKYNCVLCDKHLFNSEDKLMERFLGKERYWEGALPDEGFKYPTFRTGTENVVE